MAKAESLKVPEAVHTKPWFLKQLKTALNNIIIRWRSKARDRVCHLTHIFSDITSNKIL